MANPVLDMYMMRRGIDGRNPYGSRGGYVTSRSPRRDRMSRYPDRDYAREPSSRYDSRYNDMASSRRPMESDYAMDYGRNVGYSGYYGNTPFELRSMEDYPNYDYYDGRDYARGYDRNYDRNYDMRYDYRMDYASGYKLEPREIEEWSAKLLREIDDKDKEIIKREKIMKKAEDLGIKFEHFTPEEFYLTVLMMYTDYCKIFGNANIDTYVRMAKDWLCDEDVSMKYGEKLASYYDSVVKGM